MAGASNYLIRRLYRHTFSKDITYTPPPSMELALTRSIPRGEQDGTSIFEQDGSGYARQPITFDPAEDGAISNSGTVGFVSGGAWPPTLGAAVIDDQNRVLCGDRIWPGQRLDNSGDEIRFDPGSFTMDFGHHRRRPPFLPSDLPEMIGHWWAGEKGDYLELEKVSGGATYWAVDTAYDLSSQQNHLRGVQRGGDDLRPGWLPNVEVPWPRTNWGTYNCRLPCFMSHRWPDGRDRFWNLMSLDREIQLEGEFYMAFAWPQARPDAERTLWGFDDNNFLYLDQGNGELVWRIDDVDFGLCEGWDGDGGQGVSILEIMRELDGSIRVFWNGVEHSSPINLSQILRISSFGDNWRIDRSSSGEPSSEWDDNMGEMLIYRQAPTEEQRQDLYTDLRDRWQGNFVERGLYGISDYLATTWSDFVFRGTSFTPPSDYYIALCQRCPSRSDTGSDLVEVNYPEYQRQITRWAGDAGKQGYGSNLDTLNFPATNAESWRRTAGYWAVTDAPTGGNLYAFGDLMHPILLRNNGSPRPIIRPGDLNLIVNAS